MVTTTSLKVGESLTIGLYFNDNYQLPITCNLIVFIGGVCVGNLFTQDPEIEKVGIYYTIRLSSQDTSKMRGYRDLIVILDDPEGFGNKKTIVGGILFDRLADEFITTSENQGYNMLVEMTVDQSIVSGNVELIEAIKGDKGEDAILPDGIVIDEDYIHTDNNYTDADKSLLSNALQSEVDPVYSLDKDRLLNTSGTNTGDQDLTGLVEKVPLHSLVPDSEIEKLAEYPEFEDLEFSHGNLTDKNEEAAFQHVDTTTVKNTLVEADKVALYDSVTGKVVLSNISKKIITNIPLPITSTNYWTMGNYNFNSFVSTGKTTDLFVGLEGWLYYAEKNKKVKRMELRFGYVGSNSIVNARISVNKANRIYSTPQNQILNAEVVCTKNVEIKSNAVIDLTDSFTDLFVRKYKYIHIGIMRLQDLPITAAMQVYIELEDIEL